MNKLAILLLLCGVMPAQTVTEVPQMSVSSLPTSPPLNTVVKVLDPNSASDCSVGGGNGTTFPPHECQWNGSVWALLAGACGSAANPGIPVWNGSACIIDTNASDDGNATGNFTFASVTAPTGTFTTVNTNGPGFTQTFQSQAAPSTPAVAGQMTWYGDSTTHKWACIYSDGSSCAPGGAAWSGTTAGTNANAGTFAATGNTWDFTGVTQIRLRTGAGLTTSADGGIGYDTTNKMWHVWQNGADNFLISALASGTYTNGDCTSISKSGNIINFVDSGGACGGSGSASPITFNSSSQPSSTATEFWSLAVRNGAEAPTQMPVPRSGTVSNLQCHNSTALSSAQTMTLTVRKGLASTGAITSSSTTVTCQLNSTNTNGCSDVTHNFTVAAGDVINMQSAPANSPGTGTINCSVQLL